VPLNVADDPPVFELRQLEVYLKCPRKYFYEFVLELGGRPDDSAYVQFHRCVYEVLRWVRSERIEGREPELSEANAKLDEVWQSKGPADHFYQEKYRDGAERMIANALGRSPLPGSHPVETECEVRLPHGRVVFMLDSAELVEEGPTRSYFVRRHRTGRPTKEEEDKPVYGLYKAAMQQSFPQAKQSLQIHYLSTNETKEVDLTPTKIENRLKKYDEAIAGILRRRFQPIPNDHDCPRCPHYFICPMAGDTAEA
jgi:DNA helicase-2/ATP-dependent DNA helicase PcrA